MSGNEPGSAPPKRPAPQFRPPAKRQQGRGSRFANRRVVLATAALGVLLLAAVGLTILLLTGGDESPAEASNSTSGTEGGPDQALQGPASRYVPALEEMPTGYEIRPTDTYGLSDLQFAVDTGLFRTAAEGQAKAQEWGYESGYRASYWPVGQLSDVVRGTPIVTIDTYMFRTQGGAAQAFDFLKDFYDGFKDSEKVPAKGLANQSGAWSLAPGSNIGTSDVPAIYHRFAFRRGNLVTVVQTLGPKAYMNIDAARGFAVIADERALGQRAAPTPTPAGSPLPPTPSATP
ncbi:MAG: hypothetical protein ACM3S1_13355 [Hyphomicrobiales bacterium]